MITLPVGLAAASSAPVEAQPKAASGGSEQSQLLLGEGGGLGSLTMFSW